MSNYQRTTAKAALDVLSRWADSKNGIFTTSLGQAFDAQYNYWCNLAPGHNYNHWVVSIDMNATIVVTIQTAGAKKFWGRLIFIDKTWCTNPDMGSFQ